MVMLLGLIVDTEKPSFVTLFLGEEEDYSEFY